MANYNTLKAAVAEVVKANGNNEITGALLQETLLSIVGSLGDKFQFADVANTSTIPGTPDQNVAYIAGPGTYPNFNGGVIPENYIGVFTYNGVWQLKTFQPSPQMYADIYGTTNDRVVKISVAGGVHITGNTRYPTVVDIPAGQFTLSYNGGGILSDTQLYLEDGNGNPIQAVNRYGTSVASIQATAMASQSPYTIPSRVRLVKLYGGTPSASGDLTFSFDATEPGQKGLLEKVGNLDDLATADKVNLVAAINEIYTDTHETDVLRPVVYKTQIEQLGIGSGFWWNGANASDEYFYVHFTDLKDGDLILLRNDDAITCRCRFLQGYKGNATVSGEDDNTSTLSVYRVANGVDNAYMTFYNRCRQANTYGYVIRLEKAAPDVPVPPSASSNSVSANAKIEITKALENKKNVSIEYFAKFGSFNTLRVGQGDGIFNGAYFKIDASTVSLYVGESQTPGWTAQHGLTISQFVRVHICVNNLHQARITVASAGGQYTGVFYTWAACAGNVFAVANFATQYVKLTYGCADWSNRAAMCGDSYLSYAQDRMPYYLNTVYNGYENILSCGISGGEVGFTIPAVVENFLHRVPEKFVFALGMNDPDTQTAINKSWAYAVSFIQSLCDIYGTELVLCTIPCVPNYSHVFKNAFVKASGNRYIDFALAVNAESAGATWYAGMLSADNVHPTALGAATLASRFVQDFPDTIGKTL